MKNTFAGVVGILILGGVVYAQQVVPNPVADTEVRDNNSVRMRALALERAKRENRDAALSGAVNYRMVGLSEIKDDFEGIQLLQDKIVKTYTTGKKINFQKIGKLSAEIAKRAARMNAKLFEPETDRTGEEEAPVGSGAKSVWDLIIDLDGAIAKFVKSPIFLDEKVVDFEDSRESQAELREVIRLSRNLSGQARSR